MAQIDIRYATIRLKDGFTGSGAVNHSMGYASSAVTMAIDGLAGLPDAGTVVPVGARFTVGAGDDIYTVTDHSESMGSTTSITFTPGLASMVADDAAITFLPCQVEINVGEGNITWTEKRQMDYKRDRGGLDTVVQGDDQPMEVKFEFLYEFYTSNADGFEPSPVDFMKRTGDAAELASSSSDPCEPFSLDVEVTYTPPCNSQDPEVITFPDFRWEQLDGDYRAGTLSITGKCNAVEPIAVRDDS